MPKIGNLLDEDTLQKLQNVVLADMQVDQPARPIQAGEYRVIKAATDPNPPRALKPSDYIMIDPRGEAMFDTECVDCHTAIQIDPQVPEGVDPEAPRVPICSGCALIRVKHMAMTEQRRIETVRRQAVVRRSTTNTKENDVIDLDNLNDAELGALVRTQMKAAKTEQIVAAAPEVKAKRKQAEKKAKDGVTAEQERRRDHCLPGFMVGTTLEVPALDLSQVSSLDESPSAMERSPYNKARFRLEKSGPLDPEDCTYGFLEKEHERLRALVTEHNKASKPVQVVVAVNDDDEVLKTKAKALAKVMGISKKDAKALILASA